MSECNWYNPSCSLGWLKDELHAFSLWLWESILNGLAVAFEAIPVPGFLQTFSTFSMPPGVAYFLEAFEIHFGLGVVVSAYIARFILRRIPGIG